MTIDSLYQVLTCVPRRRSFDSIKLLCVPSPRQDIGEHSVYCNGNCPCQNFRCKISFKSDMALKHAQCERITRKASQKSRNHRPRRTNARDDRKDVYSVCRTRYCANPWEIDTTIVTKTSVPDACLNIPAVSCVVTSASAGSHGQFPLNDSNC